MTNIQQIRQRRAKKTAKRSIINQIKHVFEQAKVQLAGGYRTAAKRYKFWTADKERTMRIVAISAMTNYQRHQWNKLVRQDKDKAYSMESIKQFLSLQHPRVALRLARVKNELEFQQLGGQL